MSNVSKDFAKGIKLYSKATEQEKCILYLMAMAYFPIKRTVIESCLKKLPDVLGRGIPKIPLDAMRGNVIGSYNSEISSDFRHLIMNDAINSPYFSQLHRAFLDELDSYSKKNMGSGAYFEKEFFVNCYRFQTYVEYKEYVNLRLALYMDKEDEYNRISINMGPAKSLNFLSSLFKKQPLTIEWLSKKPISVQLFILREKLINFLLRGECIEQMPDLLSYFLPLRGKKGYEELVSVFLCYDIHSGQIEKAEATLIECGNPESASVHSILSMCSFLKGNNEEALKKFDVSLKMLRKLSGKRKILFEVDGQISYIMALFMSNNKAYHKTIKAMLEIEEQERNKKASWILQDLLKTVQGISNDLIGGYELNYNLTEMSPLVIAFLSLALFWMSPEKDVNITLPILKNRFESLKNLLPMVAKIYAEMIIKLEPKNSLVKDFLSEYEGMPSFINCVQIEEEWQRKLLNLEHIMTTLTGGPSKIDKADVSAKQLIWHFDTKHKELEPIEQTINKGKTSKGRAVSLKRLYEGSDSLDYLTSQDKSIIATIRKQASGWSGRYVEYDFDDLKMPLALIGCPNIYDANAPNLRLDFIAASPELIVKKIDEKNFHISLSVFSLSPKVFIEKETPTLYKVVDFPKSWIPLVEILGDKGIKVPAIAKDNILALIAKAGAVVSINSDLVDANVKIQDADSTLRFHLTPLDLGIRICLYVRPIKDAGPYFRPGQGSSTLSILVDGKPIRVTRDLKAERKAADKVMKACPQLELVSDQTDEWVFDNPVDCLELLEELQNAEEKHKFIIEWPEGQKLKLTKPVSFNGLSLKIKEDKGWFNLKGEVRIDEDTVIDFQRLLQLLDQSPSRFIPLDDKTYISLTSHLKKQLLELNSFVQPSKDGSKIHGLGSFALKNLTDNAPQITSDKAWKEKLQQFKDVEAFEPKLPVTLQANLREYQKEGFDWLSRLSALGMGACLADDMGLGKTLQALAVLLNHAPKGPCIVVAPTSVCHNWVSEIVKFAPTLTSHSLNMYQTTAKRKELIESLGPMDVLICSYSLLQQEEDLLAKMTWEMIVLDEAQAIKNSTTKRFQAAIKLNGSFKLALTGTPIENHGDEIWSLFSFIAPGLLGSLDSFRKRFLEQSSRRASLKSLIQMFILRRTKNIVLQELPSRTDQTLLIDMDPEEFSFYEALRREALVKISGFDKVNSGQRKIHILAEMTKLRQACCHPKLANKDVGLSSSKLKAFSRLVDDLLENKHQALVFSQYVGYLKLVREVLDQKNIPYQYLDGSTPAQMRKQQVDDFQSGKSSIFLLSLKAGGSGLNLTAADYVIHLDPWWNPAVEDQASDRAHRLGQTRPVTVYRLIMKNTIEEKILALHQSKREMAAEILDGTHISSALSEDALMGLISEVGEVELQAA